jgi:Tfp pilus assembly protein FimT
MPKITHSFTLIQCLLTIAIISLLYVFAKPNYLPLQQKHLAIATLKTIQQGIQYARMQAIGQHQVIIMEPIKGNDWASGFTVNDAATMQKTYNFTNKAHLTWHGFGQLKNKILILPNGMTHNNGHFTLVPKQSLEPITSYTLFLSKPLKTRIVAN